jgi:hypothetical protein
MHRLAYIANATAFLLCSLLAIQFARAQQLDSTHRIGSMHPMDTAASPNDTGGFHMKKSALEAVLLSTIIPGAGQVYLGQTWKLPILYGLIGAFGYFGVYTQNFRYHYTIDSINNENARKNSHDSTLALQLVSNREFYRNDRDKWWIYLGLTYVADILDAYIAANLYDFDVSDPAPSPLQSYYDPIDRRVGLSFTIKF